ESAIFLLPIEKVRIRNRAGSKVRLALAKDYELFRMRKGKRPQKNAVYDAEESRVGTDSECENNYGGKSKNRIVAKLAETVTAIGKDRVQPVADPLIANLFFHLFDAAKFEPGGALCFFRWHAGTNVFVRQHLQVAMNLLSEVRL